jgi:hypothetical protein
MLKFFKELFVCLAVIVQAANAFEWNDQGWNIWALDCDFYGNDLTRVNVAGEFCSEECGKVAACTHYSWANGVCYLKFGVICKSNAVHLSGGVCGIVGLQTGADCLSAPVELMRGELLWSDEFNGAGSPDAAKWIQEIGGGGWGNNELQIYTDRNANMKGGNLEIVSKQESKRFFNQTIKS